MLTKFTYKRLAWIDLENPTKDEVREVMESYDIHPLVAEELLGKSVRPKVDYYGNQIYLVLHFPTVTHSHDGNSWQEVDFVIGKNFLITVHYETVDPLLEFSKIFEVNSILEKSNMGEHSGFLYFYIMKELYKTMSEELIVIGKELHSIEDNIFKGSEHSMVARISSVNRKLINFRQATRFHKDILESFEIASKDLFGDKFSFYARSILGECFEMGNVLDGHRETLRDLWETNDSLLTSKTNQTMKALAIMAALLLPASLVGQIFGISSGYIPFMNDPNSFFIVMSLMVLASAVTYVGLRGKKMF